MDAIQVSHLTKYYGNTRGVEDISLTVSQGEFFGFIGPNGAGKSTTIRTLVGLIRPTQGSAQVLGLDVGKSREQILARIGYLPSEIGLYPGMRVGEVLRLSASLRGMDCRAAAEGLCARLRLDPSKRTEELSYGNRKKAAIVCALQHDPELLILDEPTGGLDPLMQKEFFDILRERNQAGATIFLSSHVLSEIQRNCTRAAIIREGKILTCGRLEALSKTGAKRVSVQGHVEVSALAGVRDLQTGADSTRFLYSGDWNELLLALSGGTVRDLTVAEPDLEEVFLHFYEGDEKK